MLEERVQAAAPTVLALSDGQGAGDGNTAVGVVHEPGTVALLYQVAYIRTLEYDATRPDRMIPCSIF